MSYWVDQRRALTLIRPMSSDTRQLIPLYQAQCQAQIGTLFYGAFCYFLCLLPFLGCSFNSKI